MQAQPSATQRPPLFVGRRETCRLLNISIHTLEKMLASGEIPSRRLRSKPGDSAAISGNVGQSWGGGVTEQFVLEGTGEGTLLPCQADSSHG